MHNSFNIVEKKVITSKNTGMESVWVVAFHMA